MKIYCAVFFVDILWLIQNITLNVLAKIAAPSFLPLMKVQSTPLGKGSVMGSLDIEKRRNKKNARKKKNIDDSGLYVFVRHVYYVL